ncbi:uncharacterized protein [Musca autumnalis]|uniref:uncharacterized protein n=1 Tax=Musca autumnalis TaxID=221902 RepID=UPI003CEEE0A5
MSATNFNKIASNCDVMIHIYKFLNFVDQLRLAQVDEYLRSIFLQYIWPISYNKLRVIEFDDDYIISNETDADRILFRNATDLKEFLKFYGKNVNDLFTDTPLQMDFFRNLIKLKCHIQRVTVDDMVQLTNALPNLEELQVYAYRFETRQRNACIARGIVAELLRFLKLKKLKLNIDHFNCKMKFKDFWEIVTKLPLEIMELNIPIIFDSDDNEFELQQSPLPLMQLEITTIGNDGRFLAMLNSFRNLKVLTIRLKYHKEMASALVSLTQLHQLTIYATDFCEVTNLILPPNITRLHLYHCYGLSLENLQQFLDEHSYPKLIEFVTIGTYFRVKEFKQLHISSRIKTLNIESFDLSQFHSPFVANSALENLTLHPADDFVFGIPLIKLNSISNCHNLHTLDVQGQQLALDTLLNLRNLKKLSLHVILPEQGFYIIRILQELPLLRELVVQQFATSPSPSLQAVVTSVCSLKIFCLEHSSPLLGFWFDIFTLNPQLELQLQIDISGTQTLQDLIENEKFPRNLRKIQICGFTVDCNKLRNNFETVLSTIKYSIEEYDSDNPSERKCNIIMSRNKK